MPDKVKKDREELQKQLEEKELKVSQTSGQGNSKNRSEPELKKYAEQIRAKTKEYKTKRQHLAEIKNESVVLSRTEQILKGRDKNLKDYIEKQEAKKGVSGFNETKNKMEEVSEKMSQVNEMKGKTLAEISMVVTNINQTLKERKNKLAPQIKELRTVRQRFQEFEQEYFEKKALFENKSVGLETERLKLEQECAAFQQDCIEQERTYHITNCLLSIKETQLQKVEDEERMKEGKGGSAFLGGGFKNWEELYKNKIATEEGLSRTLRSKQRDLKQDEGDFMEQKVLFNDLAKLLRLKLKLTTQQSNQGVRMSGGAETMSFGGGGGVGMGQTNVMTLDD
jgi:intraflagellar transport protein 81